MPGIGVGRYGEVLAHLTLPPPEERRAIRELAGLSQEDVGVLLGVSQACVGRYEAGQRRPRGDLLVRYAGVLRDLRDLVATVQTAVERDAAAVDDLLAEIDGLVDGLAVAPEPVGAARG